MRTVVTLGESLIDFISTKSVDLVHATGFDKAPGGAPANVAAAVSRLGGKAAFVGKRGQDPFGRFLAETLQNCGVDTHFFTETDKAKTALAFVSLTEEGERSFMFYRDPSADMLLESDDVPLDFITEAGILHVGSVSLSTDPARAATIHAVRESKQRGVFVSYDPNWRPPLWPDEKYGMESIGMLYEYCDLIKVNREELWLLAKTEDVRDGAQYFHDRGIPLVLITLDAQGCYYSYQGSGGDVVQCGHVPGIPVQCVDTTGAGDAFLGAFLYRFANAAEPHLLETQVREWVQFAVAASALVTLKKGAMSAMPSLSDVINFVGRSGKQVDA